MKMIVNQLKESVFKRLGFLGIGLCVLCCTLPVLGAIVGLSVFTTIAFYLEKVAILLLVTSLTLFTFWYLKKKNTKSSCASSCEVDCNCKDDSHLKNLS